MLCSDAPVMLKTDPTKSQKTEHLGLFLATLRVKALIDFKMLKQLKYSLLVSEMRPCCLNTHALRSRDNAVTDTFLHQFLY